MRPASVNSSSAQEERLPQPRPRGTGPAGSGPAEACGLRVSARACSHHDVSRAWKAQPAGAAEPCEPGRHTRHAASVVLTRPRSALSALPAGQHAKLAPSSTRRPHSVAGWCPATLQQPSACAEELLRMQQMRACYIPVSWHMPEHRSAGIQRLACSALPSDPSPSGLVQRPASRAWFAMTDPPHAARLASAPSGQDPAHRRMSRPPSPFSRPVSRGRPGSERGCCRLPYVPVPRIACGPGHAPRCSPNASANGHFGAPGRGGGADAGSAPNTAREVRALVAEERWARHAAAAATAVAAAWRGFRVRQRTRRQGACGAPRLLWTRAC